ncbi:unnamed protein product [Dracunculus medinensis]|uniref:Thyroglobulin type-1 domain-containing protein n=1 Tax=Dracunculus medinensis TaxID=318479 RepID=A0A0N4UCT5_DRAME|nr:unnamed protein product [Dracunculus medinensis]
MIGYIFALSLIQGIYSNPLSFHFDLSGKCDSSVICNDDDMKMMIACGNDGRTYNSSCEIKMAICQGYPIKQHLPGQCPENLICPLERSFQSSRALQLNNTNIFIPECNETDGSYLPVQCHNSSTYSYCWCVTRLGRPLPLTSVKNAKPNCTHSSCTYNDRWDFTMNLLTMIKEEFLKETVERGATLVHAPIAEGRPAISLRAYMNSGSMVMKADGLFLYHAAKIYILSLHTFLTLSLLLLVPFL